MAADGLMCDALEAADLLIGFGLDPVEIDKTWHAELPIHLAARMRRTRAASCPTASALVDHAALLDALVARAAAGRVARRRSRDFRRSGASCCTGARQCARTRCGRAISFGRWRRCVPPETIVTTDVGSHKYLFGQFWPSRQP